MRRLSRALAVPRLDIGVAGMKDRRAVTRQRISLPARCEDRLRGLREESERLSEGESALGPGISILGWERHPHKLRTGHLAGNRFTIRLRGTGPEALQSARAVAAEIGHSGYPNYFGDQRFGRDRETLELGLALLAGTKTPPRHPAGAAQIPAATGAVRRAIGVVQRGAVAANRESHLRGGASRRRVAGPRQWRIVCHGRRAARAGAIVVGEVSLTGPLFGPKMKGPTASRGKWKRRC